MNCAFLLDKVMFNLSAVQIVYNEYVVLFGGDINYNKNNIKLIESQLLPI